MKELERLITEKDARIAELEAQVEKITDIVCRSAPVTWASAEWLEEAHKFEKDLCEVLKIGKNCDKWEARK